MEDLEAQANKARRKTEDPDKLMEQLQLIQKKQKELMQMQLDLQVWYTHFSIRSIFFYNAKYFFGKVFTT